MTEPTSDDRGTFGDGASPDPAFQGLFHGLPAEAGHGLPAAAGHGLPAAAGCGDDAPGSVDLDDPEVVQRILRYDDLEPEELARIERDPSARELLNQLRSVDRHLLGRQPVAAEALYAYGGGPGAQALDTDQRTEVRRWLASHPVEAGWTESLHRRPPSPLVAEAPSEPERAPAPGAAGPRAADAAARRPRAIPFEHRVRAMPSWLVWTPFAAAALVLAMAFSGGEQSGIMAGGLPDSPLLRSAEESPLFFPRGRVIATTSEGGYAHAPLLEVAPRERATGYRFSIALLPEASSAFEAGETIWSTRTTRPLATAPALAVGSYEWSAWAVVDGIDLLLGTLSFRVVEAPEGLAEAADGGSDEPRAVREAVHRLHAAGYLTDARHRARALPAGDERDAYLARPR